MTTQERIERAYRLADIEIVAGRPLSAGEAWDAALEDLVVEDSLSWAILSLALLDEGGGTLGRWEVFADDGGEIDRILLDSDTYANRNDQYQWVTGAWPASAYLDGTASELLLLMCAADELSRREVQS